MSKTLFKEAKKARTTVNLRISRYEKTVILKRLERAVEQLKDTRKEIQQCIQIILKMKEDGNDIADQALIAVAEMYPKEGNPWILSASAKTKMKKEAAKPLLLLRVD